MTDKGDDLVLGYINSDTVKNLDVFLGGVGKLHIFKLNATVLFSALGPLSAFKQNLVWSDDKKRDLVGGAKDLGDSLDIVSNGTSIVHNCAGVKQNGGDFTNGELEVLVSAADSVNDGDISKELKGAEGKEEERPEVTLGAAILKNILACDGEPERSVLLISEGLDSTDVRDGLSGDVAHLTLRLLIANGESVEHAGCEAGRHDGWQHASDDDQSKQWGVGEKNHDRTDENA